MDKSLEERIIESKRYEFKGDIAYVSLWRFVQGGNPYLRYEDMGIRLARRAL
jgi:hypothetical protein